MSKRFTFTEQDRERWLRNVAIYAIPAALVFFQALESGKTLDEALIAIKVWGLSTIVDLLKKYLQES